MCRFDKPEGEKEFYPLTYGTLAGRTGWHWKAPPAPRPLYGLDRLAKRPNAPVIVCEGEKAADAAERLFPEFVAVTSPNGAKAADKADWTPLAGRDVTIWPDHDDEGARYAADVARLASKAGAASVAIVDVPEQFPHKWDLADDPPSGWTAGAAARSCSRCSDAKRRPSIRSPIDEHRRRAGTARRPLPSSTTSVSRKDTAKALNIRASALDREVNRRRGDASEGEGPGPPARAADARTMARRRRGRSAAQRASRNFLAISGPSRRRGRCTGVVGDCILTSSTCR